MADEVTSLFFELLLERLTIRQVVPVGSKILFEKKEVYIHEPPKDEVNGSLMDANKIGGQLQILKNVSSRD